MNKRDARVIAKRLGLEFVDWNTATMRKKREIVGNEERYFVFADIGFGRKGLSLVRKKTQTEE